MKPVWIVVVAGTVALAFPMTSLAAAYAEPDPVYFGDVDIVYQPQPSGYRPEGSEIDLADQGKSFDIACIIGGDGKLSDCEALDNGMVDQNFVRVGLGNVGQWVVAPRTHDGEPVDGRTLLVTCAFQRSDRTDVATSEGAK